MIDFRSIHLDHQVILMDRRIQPGKFRLVTHIVSYFFFNYIHHILVHCHSACFCNRHPFNLLLHRFLCIFIEIMSRCLMVCRSVSRVCFFCSLMFRFTACISSMDVIDSCQPLFTIIFLVLLLVLEVSGCFSYNGMNFRLQLPFRIFLCGYRKLFSINRTVYNNICLSCGLTHKIRISLRTSGADQLADNRKISH